MSKKSIVFFSFFLTCFAAGVSQAAESVHSTDLTDKIQQRYETITSFQADFVQELTNIASGDVQIRKGQISFKQPSQVRWETNDPTKELLIVGPDFAWNYIEDEKLALKYSVGALLDSKTILRFISGQANLKEDFVIKSEWEGADKVRARWGKAYTVLQLIPKEAEPGMVLAFIGVEPKTGLLRQIMIVDFYGNGNELRLSNVKTNVRFSKKMFDFIPPEGTLVEDNTQAF